MLESRLAGQLSVFASVCAVFSQQSKHTPVVGVCQPHPPRVGERNAMAVLSDASILRVTRSRSLGIRPFHRDALEPASYDMRLYWKLLVSPTRYEAGHEVDLRKEPQHTFGVEPGRFVAILTEELLRMPVDLSGRFGLKSEYTRRGLVAFPGIQVDPGFRGRLAVSLFNAGPEPVKLKQGAKMFTVEFHTLESPALHPYNGPYQNQHDFPPDQKDFVLNAHTASLAEIASMPGEISGLHQRLVILESSAAAVSDPESTEQLIASQGIKPVESLEELSGGWPKGQDFNKFLRRIKSFRTVPN